MAEKLKVRLVTPDRILVDQAVEAVEVPAKNGYIEVLRGHAPLLAEIGAGEMRLHGGESGDLRYTVARGFVEVLPDRVTILVEYAQKPEDVDTSAAEAQMEQGQKLWSEAGEDAGKYAHANEVMAEAEAKIESAAGRG
ncbi:MAG: ATP synthase F1 subunit epsilon [Acidobacteriaceae bacterium]